MVIHSLHFLRLFHAVPPTSITLSGKGNNHLFIAIFKLITYSDPREKWLLLSVYHPSSYLQHWSETAGLSGQSTSLESQNSHSRWGHSSSRFRNWSSDSVHPEGSVQRQHSVNNSSPDKHHHGLRQVRSSATFLRRKENTGNLCEPDKPNRVLVNSNFTSVLFLSNPQSFTLEIVGAILHQLGTNRLIKDHLFPYDAFHAVSYPFFAHWQRNHGYSALLHLKIVKLKYTSTNLTPVSVATKLSSHKLSTWIVTHQKPIYIPQLFPSWKAAGRVGWVTSKYWNLF